MFEVRYIGFWRKTTNVFKVRDKNSINSESSTSEYAINVELGRTAHWNIEREKNEKIK